MGRVTVGVVVVRVTLTFALLRFIIVSETNHLKFPTSWRARVRINWPRRANLNPFFYQTIIQFDDFQVTLAWSSPGNCTVWKIWSKDLKMGVIRDLWGQRGVYGTKEYKHKQAVKRTVFTGARLRLSTLRALWGAVQKAQQPTSATRRKKKHGAPCVTASRHRQRLSR